MRRQKPAMEIAVRRFLAVDLNVEMPGAQIRELSAGKLKAAPDHAGLVLGQGQVESLGTGNADPQPVIQRRGCGVGSQSLEIATDRQDVAVPGDKRPALAGD